MKKLTLLLCVLCLCFPSCNKQPSSTENYFESDNTVVSDEASKQDVFQNKNMREDEDINKEIEKIKEEVKKIGAEKSELLFNGIPWGTNFLSAYEEMKKIDGLCEMGLLAIPISIDSLLGSTVDLVINCNNSKQVGGMTWSILDKMYVAGYEVSECQLLFSSMSTDDGWILSDECSVLYGACYIFEEPSDNSAVMIEDLKNKLCSLYGSPDKVMDYPPFVENGEMRTYTYWYGANNTIIALHDTKISYIWLDGEELLDAALHNVLKMQQEEMESVYGNGDTDGL